jgi:ubiquinone/menaquinone biosynthesis C-methylase UbiE
MSEFNPYEAIPEDIDRNYARSAANVRARFEVYKYAADPLDVEEKALDSLELIGKLSTHSTVMDVGTADAALLDILRINHGHEGPFWGIDPNTNQFINYDRFDFKEEDWAQLEQAKKTPPIDLEALKKIQAESRAEFRPFLNNVRLLEGRAQDLGTFEDDSVDVLFAMFMLYHLPRPERNLAFQGFRRVLRPPGVFVVATSGQYNKKEHREFERLIAEELGIQPPAPMNAGFTTEKAQEEVPKFFRHFYLLDHQSEIQLEREGAVWSYISSLKSLRDQFKPVPEVLYFEEAIKRIVIPSIAKQRQSKGYFTDYAHRSLGFGSDEPLDGLVEAGFKRIS